MTTLHQLRTRLTKLQEAATPRSPPITATEAADNARVAEIMQERPELSFRAAFMVMFEERY